MGVNSSTASYVNSVASGADSLLQRLGTPGAGQAAVILERRARHGLDEFGPVSEAGVPDLEELSQAMARLAVAGTLLAADRATQSGAEAEAHTAFAASITQLSATGNELEVLATPPAAGFGPSVPPSPNAAAAADRLRRQADDTLKAVLDQATGIVESILNMVTAQPKQLVENALSAVGVKMDLGEWLGELAALARHLVEWVLARLSRLLPQGQLERTRKRVKELMDAPDLKNAVAAVLGVDDVKKAVGRFLAKPGLDRDSLDHGTGQLATLAGRYVSAMRWVRISLVVIPGLSVAGAVPYAPLLVPLLLLTVMCAMTVLSIGYVDSGHGLGLVQGVQHVVAHACGELT